MLGNPFIPTNEVSTKVFIIVTGFKTPGSVVAKLHHPVQEPVRTVDIVLGPRDQSLVSGEKFAKVGYVSIYNNKEVNI
jgi:hypothetical protein